VPYTLIYGAYRPRGGLNFDHVVAETNYTTDMDALLKAADTPLGSYDRETVNARRQVQRLIGSGVPVDIDVIADQP
jgi:hypothetical protein